MQEKIYLSENDIHVLETYGSLEKHSETGVTLKIQKRATGSHSVIARVQGRIVGVIGTSDDKKHDAMEVIKEYRKQGIGALLWQLKVSLDGYQLYEWSAKYSRLRFLIRHGYYPIGTTFWANLPHTPLTKKERKMLVKTLSHEQKDDNTSRLYVLKRAPIRALWLSYYL